MLCTDREIGQIVYGMNNLNYSRYRMELRSRV